MKIFGKTNYDFQGKRYLALSFSGALILISLISLVLHGGPNYSIDFKGGLKVEMRVTEPAGKPALNEEQVRASLNKAGFTGAEVKMSRSTEGEDLIIQLKEETQFKPPEALIRSSLDKALPEGNWRLIPNDQVNPDNLPDLFGISFVAIETETSPDVLENALRSTEVDNPRLITHQSLEGKPIFLLTGEGRDAVSMIRKVLLGDNPDYMVEVRAIDRVGPKIGAELRLQALLSIIVSLGLIVLFLWWRFELLFGVAAVVALFHDVIITLGLFSVLNMEISITVIGAFLTLVGYSLNDTIVVFDRIRETMKKYKDAEFSKIVNRSINDTLSRTVITGGTTLLVVAVLFFNGGEVLHSFSLALLFGILIGTYSSVFIASPILVEWAARTHKAMGRKMLAKKTS